MHIRRFASLLLGAWLSGSLLMMTVATHNFDSVDRLLKSPAPRVMKITHDLGQEGAEAFLRFQAAELNRWYFETWEWVQIGLGIPLLVVFQLRVSASRTGTALAGLMLAAVVIMRFFLSGEIARLGGQLAFVPLTGMPATREQFRHYHLAYGILEIVKLGLGMVLTALLLHRRGSGSRRRVREVPAKPAC